MAEGEGGAGGRSFGDSPQRYCHCNGVLLALTLDLCVFV